MTRSKPRSFRAIRPPLALEGEARDAQGDEEPAEHEPDDAAAGGGGTDEERRADRHEERREDEHRDRYALTPAPPP